MKTRKYIYTTLATCLFVFSSCLNDLDVLPLDPTVETADKAYTDAESYTKGLHKIILSLGVIRTRRQQQFRYFRP